MNKIEHTFELTLHRLGRKGIFTYNKCEDSNGGTYYEVTDKNGEEETPDIYYPTKEDLKEFLSKYE